MLERISQPRGRKARAERRRAEAAEQRRAERSAALAEEAALAESAELAEAAASAENSENGEIAVHADDAAHAETASHLLHTTPDTNGSSPSHANGSALDGRQPPPDRTRMQTGEADGTSACNAASVGEIGVVAGIERGGITRVLVGSALHVARVSRDLAQREHALAVGDRVRFQPNGLGGGTILGVEPRRTRLARIREDRSRRSEHAREEAVLAANVDIAVIVAAVAQPAFHPKLLDRFLVICQYGGITPILCLNKCDLVEAPPDVSIYEQLGLPIVYASAASGAGLDELRGLLRGNVAVFTGHSGVGKSSLVNALLGEDRQVTGAVRNADGRGRHTTTSSTVLPLDDDTYVVDTPGVRSLGIWKIDPQTLGSYFPDFDAFSQSCRFSSCSHVHEPACAVKEAAETGEIPRQRYESYVRLMEG